MSETHEEFVARIKRKAHEEYTTGFRRADPCTCQLIPVEGVECIPCWARGSVPLEEPDARI